jgi:hypothetical protein
MTAQWLRVPDGMRTAAQFMTFAQTVGYPKA